LAIHCWKHSLPLFRPRGFPVPPETITLNRETAVFSEI
jgi:hypothetical protein